MHPYARRLLNIVQRSDIWPYAFRNLFLKLMGYEIGHNALVASSVDFEGEHIRLGPEVFINKGCHIDGAAQIDIGADVHIGPHVIIATTTHDLGGASRRAGPPNAQPITIGDGAWVCAGSILRPGSVVAPGCVLSVGCVLVKPTEPDGLYGGNPAQRIKTLGAAETVELRARNA
ncbi:MAG TPA: acyltransferase [Caulobacteraceae bacterium]|nr:acyltransferase [Caulobacteraceae bacterium]